MEDSLKRWEDVSNQAISTFTNRPTISNWGYLPNSPSKPVASAEDITPTPYFDKEADLFNTSIREAFNTQYLNVNRYYEHPAHKRLGYSLYRDNESYYNQNTAWTGDFIRAMKHFGPGYRDGFMSNYNGIATLFSGKALKPSLLDQQKGREAEEAAGIAMSTRGGLGQSLVNIPYNLNYTLGIASSMIVEDLALAALIPETGGASGVAAVGNTVLDVGKIVKSLFTIGNRAKNLDKVNDARRAWSSLRTNVLKTITPETYRVGKGFYKTAEGATDLAKLGNATKQLFSTGAGFGAVYRDLRLINLAVDESGVEAVGVRSSRMNEMLQDFSITEGRMPTQREYEQMVENANAAMTRDYFANLPVIYLTNQITFGNMGLKPRFVKNWARNLIENSAGKIVSKNVVKGTGKEATKQLGKKTFDVVEKQGTLRTVANIFTKRESAKDFLLSTGRYFKANLSEGAQELYQNFMATSLEDYYREIYRDPKMTGFKGYAHATSAGFDNMFSQEGFEAFMGGILGGGAVNTLSKSARVGNEFIMKKFNPETYESNREKQKEALYNLADMLNKEAQDPANFLAPDIKSLVEAVKANEDIAKFAAEGNFKGIEDIRAVSLYAKINSLESTGTTDVFIEALEEMKDLSDAEKIEAFGTETAEQADQIIDTVVGRTKKIQANHKMVNEMFPVDRFNPNQFKIGTPERNQEIFKQFGYEQAKLDLIFNMNQYTTGIERIDAIYDSAVKAPAVAGMNNVDFAILFNTDATKANSKFSTTGSLEEERELTQAEIKRLEDSIAFSRESAGAEGATPETKAELEKAIKKDQKLLEQQKKKDELLREYQEALYDVAQLDSQLKLKFGEDEERFRKALQAYLSFIAETKNVFKNAQQVNELADKILDTVALSQDLQSAIVVINALSDEESLLKRSQVHTKGIEAAYEYILEANKKIVLLDAQKGVILNELIEALEGIGVAIETEDLLNLMISGTPPTNFISNVAGSVDENGAVIEGSELWEQIQEILDQYEISIIDAEGDVNQVIGDDPKEEKEDEDGFVETGEVSDDVLTNIATKIKDGEKLTDEEQDIYQAKGSEIEEKLKEFAAKEAKTKSKKPAPKPKTQKAKYQVKKIESDLKGTEALAQMKQELSRENARRKAKGEKQISLQQFINSVPLAEELITKGYSEVEAYKRNEIDAEIVELFRNRIKQKDLTIDKLNEIKQETLDSLNDVMNFPEEEFEKAKLAILARDMNVDAEEQGIEPISDENKEEAQENANDIDASNLEAPEDGANADDFFDDINIC